MRLSSIDPSDVALSSSSPQFRLTSNSIVHHASLTSSPAVHSAKDDEQPAYHSPSPPLTPSTSSVPFTSPPSPHSSTVVLPSHLVHVTLSIAGMSCASCSNTIERHLLSQPAILRCCVNLLMESAEVTLDEERGKVEEVVSWIEEVGFDAKVTRMKREGDEERKEKEEVREEETITLNIAGMTCASCVQTVEGALAALPFIISSTVNLITEQASVTLLPSSSLSLSSAVSSLLSTIDDVGFTATLRPTSPPSDHLSLLQRAHVLYYRRHFFFAITFAVPTLLLSMVFPYTPLSTPLSTPVARSLPLSGLLMWLLSTPVVVYTGPIFYRQAFSAARHLSTNMGTLVTLGVLASYTYATIGAIRALIAEDDGMSMEKQGGNPFDQSGVMASLMFFETASTLLTFIVMGKYMEAVAKGKTSEALTKLMGLQCQTATVCTGDEHSSDGVMREVEVDVGLLRRGDVVKVVRGGKIPADGVIVRGEASINESLITGESWPVSKRVDHPVIGSTLVEEGTIHLRVTAAGADSTLQQIVRLMESAQASKAPIQAFADRLSSVFVPLVVGLAVLVFVIWLGLAVSGSLPLSYDEDDGAFLFSFLFGISVVVIACPCALGLATPTAVMVGTGVGAKLGVLIKGGRALETAHRITAFVFDKTGTLTIGRPVVKHFTVLTTGEGWTVEGLAWLLGCSERDSEHVLGRACVEFAKVASGRELISPSSFTAVTGRGLQCEVESRSLLIGNREWMALNGVALSNKVERLMAEYEEEAETVLCMAIDSVLTVLVGLSDALKPEALSVLTHLQSMSIKTWMCTGDHLRTAAVVARHLSLPSSSVIASALPTTKFELVRRLQSEGEVVAFIGDGINDAAAISSADLGVAIGGGAEVAMEAADVVLIKSDLRDVITALHLSRAVMSRIRLNFVLALLYNVCSIPVAAGVLFPVSQVRLPPELAAFAMAMSSVSVLVSSLGLKRYKKPIISNTGSSSTSATSKKKVEGEGEEMKETLLMREESQHDGCCPCDGCMCATSHEEEDEVTQQTVHEAVVTVMSKSPPTSPRVTEEKEKEKDEGEVEVMKEEEVGLPGVGLMQRKGKGVRGACCQSQGSGAPSCTCRCGTCSCGQTAPMA